MNEDHLQEYQGTRLITIESDPLDDLLNTDDVPINKTPIMSSTNVIPVSRPVEQPNETLYMMNNRYQYDYIVVLNNTGEDGLMDTYLNEANVEGERPRADPSDWFNFGLDEEKWIKLLNKNILMHYERHLLNQDKGVTGQNIMPMRGVNPPMNQMPPQFFYPYGMRPMAPYDNNNINK
jgi:hypothetical protein